MLFGKKFRVKRNSKKNKIFVHFIFKFIRLINKFVLNLPHYIGVYLREIQ